MPSASTAASEPLRQKPCRNLEAGQRPGKHRLHQTECGKAEPEFVLPDRQHHIDEIGIAVVQRMRAAGDADARRSSSFALAGAIAALRSCFTGRRSTNVVLTNEITGSPCWLSRSSGW